MRCKKRLWRKHGREQLESFRLAPWASRRRGDLLELLDRLNPTIAELSQASQGAHAAVQSLCRAGTVAADAPSIVGDWPGTLDPGAQPKKRILVNISAGQDGTLSGTTNRLEN
jgi:hypothetical protein